MDTYNPGGATNSYKTYIDRGTSDDKSDIHFTSVDGKRTYISYPIGVIEIELIGILIMMVAMALAMFM